MIFHNFTAYFNNKLSNMGKGDRKTKRGKIILGSYGKRRRKNRVPLFVAPAKKKSIKETPPVEEEVVAEIEEATPPKAEVKKVAAKKTPAKKTTATKKTATPKKTATAKKATKTVKKADTTDDKAPAKPKATKKTTVKKTTTKKAVTKKAVKPDSTKEE